MNVGIDSIRFYTSHYFVDLRTLAAVRGVDPDKYLMGIGQEKMAIPPPDEDIVTMAASAALPIIERDGMENIELLLFSTESGIDQSKAAGIFVHGLLGLPARCRTLELKQACYSGTAALQLACAYISRRPDARALILAADVARYELGSPGEPTQGCGAVAMTVSANPRLLVVEPEFGAYTENVMDFWRPNYRDQAIVDGKYSTRVYLQALQMCWAQYAEQSRRAFGDIHRFCYHLPFTRMAEKAHERLAKDNGVPMTDELLQTQIGPSLIYNRITGNSYAASLYVGLASLFDNEPSDLAGKRIGLFSYGSGCVGEYFSGIVQPGYRESLFTADHREMLENRTELSYRQYEDIYNLPFPTDGGVHTFSRYRTGPFRLAGVQEHKRIYEKVT
ncbi:MAG: hydroxymethylglutaryl-CoA synthase [Kiritimatiellae bacterium]|nr:hydroxymethylglutaryl-CoA synthase [Kiritimatiellia bacterium]MDW8459173.1 hydroxymethylglutaryl-CoA synthase [Verrucomicrobiota bacterium]